MDSLENDLQKKLTPELKIEFRKFCLLLQAYSDANLFTYQCDFYLDDDIYWNELSFYGGGQEIQMTKPIKWFFEKVIKPNINTDTLSDYIDNTHFYNLTNTGWLHFTIFPKQNKLQIEMVYDYFDNLGTTHEENISDIVELYSKGNDDNTQTQLLKWEKQGAIFTVEYEGSNWNEYIDDTCVSNIGVTETPKLIEDLSDVMINTFEKGYYLEDEGGKGEIKFNFKEDNVLMEHTQYNKSSTEVELAELNF